MTRWRLSGYAEPGLFPGANRCRFRLCHHRDDGLVVMTVGDQRERGGKLAPVYCGFPFVTMVGRYGKGPELIAMTPHLNYEEADQRHAKALREWENMEA